jgi:hypothetical protein
MILFYLKSFSFLCGDFRYGTARANFATAEIQSLMREARRPFGRHARQIACGSRGSHSYAAFLNMFRKTGSVI